MSEIRCSKTKMDATMTIDTMAEESKPNQFPARRVMVMIANTVEAVTGPRINHLSSLRFTTRSGQGTPKKATAYAIRISSTDTSKLLRVTANQKISGCWDAKVKPKSRYG